ncbi:hypothetical protein SO694_00145024 [Aureococcus anophagefferens]|uniref:BART domain-containing protein n=1 Tax=Aureococcus anophagefferens TaxID=44056 RepID=A0ABR1FPQ9_AURAN
MASTSPRSRGAVVAGKRLGARALRPLSLVRAGGTQDQVAKVEGKVLLFCGLPRICAAAAPSRRTARRAVAPPRSCDELQPPPKEASAEAKDDYSPLPPREAKGAKGGATPPLDAAAAAELVNLVSEYLFDLFDANLMDEFLARKFEVDCGGGEFDPAEEFTFAQERLHREFVGMMEGYVEAYIAGLGRSLDDSTRPCASNKATSRRGGSDARRQVRGVLAERRRVPAEAAMILRLLFEEDEVGKRALAARDDPSGQRLYDGQTLYYGGSPQLTLRLGAALKQEVGADRGAPLPLGGAGRRAARRRRRSRPSIIQLENDHRDFRLALG